MRMLARGGNAVDAGVAATFAAAVTEISHFGLGGEVPIILYLADARRGRRHQRPGDGAGRRVAELFRGLGEIPPQRAPRRAPCPPSSTRSPSRSPSSARCRSPRCWRPAIELADGFPWYEFLTRYLKPELAEDARDSERCARLPAGPGRNHSRRGQPLPPARARAHAARARGRGAARSARSGRKAAIYAARDRFYRGDIGQRIARAVQDAGGLMTAADLAGYRGRVEPPTRLARSGPATAPSSVARRASGVRARCCSRRSRCSQGFDLERMGHNSTEYIHTVTEALKLALADRDEYYGDPDFAKVPAAGLLSDAYAGRAARSSSTRRRPASAAPGRSVEVRARRARRRGAAPTRPATPTAARRRGDAARVARHDDRERRRRAGQPLLGLSVVGAGSSAECSSRATPACRSATACRRSCSSGTTPERRPAAASGRARR